ncbi:MAG: hypothetical protein ACM3ZC_11750 [Bacteroidota bacterium]
MGKKRSLHVMVDAEIYEKFRHVCFYERITLAEVIRRLLNEYLEEKALDELEVNAPHVL